MPIASSEQPSGETDQRIDTGDNMCACSIGEVGRMSWRWCVTRLSSRAIAKEVRVDIELELMWYAYGITLLNHNRLKVRHHRSCITRCLWARPTMLAITKLIAWLSYAWISLQSCSDTRSPYRLLVLASTATG